MTSRSPKGVSVVERGRADEPANVDTRPIQLAFQLPTEQFLAMLMETITRTQAEANRTLISSLVSSNGDFGTATAVRATPLTSANSGDAVNAGAGDHVVRRGRTPPRDVRNYIVQVKSYARFTPPSNATTKTIFL